MHDQKMCAAMQYTNDWRYKKQPYTEQKTATQELNRNKKRHLHEKKKRENTQTQEQNESKKQLLSLSQPCHGASTSK